MPVGAIASTAEMMSMLRSRRTANAVYHGGSFNGNPLGCATGRVTMST